MQREDFEEILNFAISREQEAIKFYQDLQNQAQFQDQQEMLKELEAMEQNHIKIIEKIRQTGVKEEDIHKTPNLKISEYITSDPDNLDLSYMNILIKGMKREETSFLLYSEMSVKFPDLEISTLFRRLAADEAQHKKFFESLYDDWMRKGN
ncbi:MAG TPA: ferritin family protein [Candidatus Cloacimonas sp.]|jgi:rubrerythrin|nr:ferritin family protein [Candidatus Cloacimonas sp.]HPH93499.1 ferritin family protein [Candidatus Cloacimonas sp.]